jgi:redox-sensing transcriptional repressor
MEGRGANRGSDHNSVPEVVITRLPQYIRVLYSLLESGVDVVSSAQLGEQLQVTPAQIRKDLSYLGRFGKQGRGYNIRYLIAELKQVLGLNKKWNACLVGVGRLGRAILSYPGFAPEGFEIVAAFDSDPAIVGQTIAGLKVRPIDELDQAISKHKISIAIIAVPGKVAQETIKRLTDCGLKAILNYAPVYAQVPKDVKVRNVDPVLALQSMTYYLVNRS